MNYTLAGTLVLAGALMAPAAFCAPAATLLFTQNGTQIVDSQGIARPAKRGDVIQNGERLRTPPGSISQLVLPDGSLIGMRPDSELKLDIAPSVPGADKQLVSLLQGAARVISSELMDSRKPSAFTFQSGLVTLRLQGADLETALVRSDLARPSGVSDTGSYSRLLIGTGTIGSGALVEPLTPRQVSFLGGGNVAPIVVASVPPSLFTSNLRPVSPMTTPIAPAASLPGPTLAAVNVGMTSTPAARTGPSIAVSPILVTPILTAPVFTPPTTVKLPVLSCKILKTC
jgi:hypothetical protein